MFRLLLSFFSNLFSHNKLYYVVDNAKWSIRHDGNMITKNLIKIKSTITLTHLAQVNQGVIVFLSFLGEQHLKEIMIIMNLKLLKILENIE